MVGYVSFGIRLLQRQNTGLSIAIVVLNCQISATNFTLVSILRFNSPNPWALNPRRVELAFHATRLMDGTAPRNGVGARTTRLRT